MVGAGFGGGTGDWDWGCGAGAVCGTVAGGATAVVVAVAVAVVDFDEVAGVFDEVPEHPAPPSSASAAIAITIGKRLMMHPFSTEPCINPLMQQIIRK